MDVWVLGCGPSLAQVEIPSDAFCIGTNNSYKQHWSPVWAGCDLRALRRDYAIADSLRPLVWLTAIDPKRVSVKETPGRPLIHIPLQERIQLRKAGVFAYWAAIALFKATRVFLVGFDMEGDCRHFDQPGKRLTQTYIAQRYQLVQFQKETGVESWIWIEDSFHPVKSLPTTGYKLNGLYYSGEEVDVTKGIPLPQHYWYNLPDEAVRRRAARKAEALRG